MFTLLFFASGTKAEEQMILFFITRDIAVKNLGKSQGQFLQTCRGSWMIKFMCPIKLQPNRVYLHATCIPFGCHFGKLQNLYFRLQHAPFFLRLVILVSHDWWTKDKKFRLRTRFQRLYISD